MDDLRVRYARRWNAVVESPVTPAALAVLLVVSLLLYGLSHLVRHHVMYEQLYVDALEEQRFYDRIYEEVLADPVLADTVDPMLGNVLVDRAFLVSTLRLVLPPDQMRRGAEIAVADWVRYLQLERGTWEPRIDLHAWRANAIPVLSDYVASQVAVAPEQEVGTIDEFQAALEPRLFDLLQGRVPGVLPVFQPADAEEADVLASLILMHAPGPVPEETQHQVSAALLTGDMREAFALAVPAYLRPALRDAGVGPDGVGGGRFFDAIEAFERLADQSAGTVEAHAERVRSVLRLLATPLAIVSAILVAGSLHGLLWVLTRQGRSLNRWLGVTLIATSAAGLVLLLALLWGLEGYLQSLLGRLPATFPPSLFRLLGDVGGEMLTSIRWTALPALLGLSALGGIVLGARWALDRAHVPFRMLGRRRWRAGIIALSVAGAILGLGFAEITPAVRDPEGALLRCNGLRHLCDRRVDEVVFAGTHNSMATAGLGWIFPHHDRGMSYQLNAGYRALLIDTHYWDSEYALQRLDGQFPPEHHVVLTEMLARAGEPRSGPFLCHGFCGLGATPLDEGLAIIANFMRRNPHEVIILSFEDYVSPEDTVAAFEQSGLIELVYHPDEALLEDGQWPTLRELIRRNERVIVLADHRGGDPPWYLPFWTYMQDTPFDFHSPDEFSCGINRGNRDAGMLMINHWIGTLPPDRAHAVRVNRRDVILQRVEECREVRGMEPSIIAVDFYSIGDTLLVVEELNRRR